MRFFSRISPIPALFAAILGCNQYATTQELLDVRNLITDRTAPSIISPPAAGGGRATNQQITLQWSSKAAAGAYIVDVASDSGFTSAISGSPFRVAAPATSLAVTLPAAGRYYWKVRANYNTTTEYSSGVFDAIASVVYVYCPGSFTTCDDTNQGGSIASPFRTINGALAYAKTNSSITEIQVATRESGASYNETIVAVSGVSIKGAYTSTFAESARNLGTNQTKVSFAGTVLFAINVTQTTNIQGFNFIATGSSSTIALVSSCTNAFTLQNNRIETTVSQPGPSYGVLVQNSGTSPSNGPLFTNNVILSGFVTTASSASIAVKLENSSLLIRGNYIKSGTVQLGVVNFLSLTAGIQNTGSNPVMTNNVIIAGNITPVGGNAWSIGYHHFSGGGGTITNNTIVSLASNGTNAYAVALNSGTAYPLFTNNIFFNESGSVVFWEWTAGDNAVSIQNNAFLNIPNASFLYGNAGSATIGATTNVTGTPAALNTAASTANGGTVSGNFSLGMNAVAPPPFACIPFVNYAADDYRLQQNNCNATEWNNLRYGGLNTSQSVCGSGSASCGAVTTDLNAVTRTAPYSVGAYEQD